MNPQRMENSSLQVYVPLLVTEEMHKEAPCVR